MCSKLICSLLIFNFLLMDLDSYANAAIAYPRKYYKQNCLEDQGDTNTVFEVISDPESGNSVEIINGENGKYNDDAELPVVSI